MNYFIENFKLCERQTFFNEKRCNKNASLIFGSKIIFKNKIEAENLKFYEPVLTGN